MVTRIQLKHKFFRLVSTCVKICEVPRVNFKTVSQFLLNFCIILHCHHINFSVNVQMIHFLLWAKGSHQSSSFDTFECPGENLPNSCHFPSSKSVFLQILYRSSISWKVTPLYFFSSSNIYFAQKEPIKAKIFEIFECSG